MLVTARHNRVLFGNRHFQENAGIMPVANAVFFPEQRVQVVHHFKAVVVAVVHIVHAETLHEKVVLQLRVVAHQAADFHDMLPLHEYARIAAKQIHVQNGVGKQRAYFLCFQPLRNGCCGGGWRGRLNHEYLRVASG